MQKTNLSSLFLLDPAINYLNFGSFGACPRPVFEDYQQWQLKLEQEPVQFIAVRGPELLKASRQALAAYLSCSANDLVYVTNPSYAVNIVASSLGLKAGDEILATDIEYGACDKTWDYYCRQTGAIYRRQPVTLPLSTKEKFIDDFFSGLSPKTRLVFISHITSTTALRLPVEEICEIAKEKGLLTFVDGAHAPGHVPLDLSTLKADFFTGACHKWMMTPKGSSFLYVKKEFQPLDPLVVSWGYKSAYPSGSTFLDHHQMQGTRDFSAFLTIPKALAFMAEHHWPEVAASCRKLVQSNAPAFCELLRTEALCPVNDEFLGQMLSLRIQTCQPEKLQRHLYEHHKIEIPLFWQDNQVYIRFSINAFNSQAHLDHLYHALEEALEDPRFNP